MFPFWHGYDENSDMGMMKNLSYLLFPIQCIPLVIVREVVFSGSRDLLPESVFFGVLKGWMGLVFLPDGIGGESCLSLREHSSL